MQKQIDEVMDLVEEYGDRSWTNESGTSSIYRAIESKLRELLPVWQPISTAPQDGTMILLGKEGSEDYAAISTPGFWQEGWDDSIDDMGCDSGFVDLEFQEFSPGRSFGAEKYRRDPVQPTRWMPLPKAPE